MAEHILKTWPNFFDAIRFERKRFEYRQDDRGFEVGDVLVLKRWDPHAIYGSGAFVDYNDEGYDNTLRVRVTYILRDFGLPPGHCIMSIVHEKCAAKEPLP